MSRVKDIYESKFNNEWKSELDVGQFSLGWMYLQRYLDKKDGRILDAGCGNGSYSYKLIANGYSEVYAVDLFDKAPFTGNGFHYSRASIDELPYEDNFFDFVFCQSVIYYSVDYEKTARELNRVLKPGGLLYISGHTKYSIFTLSRRLKLCLSVKSVEHLKGVRFYSAGFYRKLLSGNGFDIIKTDGWGLFLLDRAFGLLSVLFRMLRLKFGDPRKRICENRFWCRFKSVAGYHFVIMAKKRGD